MQNLSSAPVEVKLARVRRGFTQEEWAARMGVVRRTVAGWEADGLPENGTSQRHFWEVVEDIDREHFKKKIDAADFLIERLEDGSRTFIARNDRAKAAVTTGAFRSCNFKDGILRDADQWEMLWDVLEAADFICAFKTSGGLSLLPD
jgi:DNA-binding XRE family transcriptional regulator